MSEPALLAWSGGKDSALALDELQRSETYSTIGLLTTVTEEYDRISMHGVRRAILRAQAAALNLPVFEASISPGAGNEQYDAAWGAAIARARDTLGPVGHVAYGDLFLEDIRAYRLAKLAGTGLEAIFPVWGIPTDRLAQEMVANGLKAYLTCVDPRALDRSFAGRVFDAKLLAELPATVDPCGERGEFHTFACEGPMFSRSISVTPAEVVERDGFVYADLLPQSEESPD